MNDCRLRTEPARAVPPVWGSLDPLQQLGLFYFPEYQIEG